MSPGPDTDALVEAAHELYARPPSEFTAARDRLVAQARGAGERELAAALKSLTRPAVAAWAVNLLVREEAALVRQVLDVGEALREAQEGLAGDALRELGRQRRELIASVVARAGGLAQDEGVRLNGQAEQQVAATLQAALADPAAAAAVLTGLLLKPLESTGLGAVSLAGHVALGPGQASPAGPRPSSRRSSAGADEEAQQAELRARSEERRRLRREAARQRVTEAEQALAERERARDAVRTRREEARAHVLHLEARIDELRRELGDLESQAETACGAVEGLDADLEEADEEVGAAQEEASAARQALSELRGG